MKDSLVLYKQTPALVTSVGDKLEILLPAGRVRSVREKDIVPLHPGPVPDISNLETDVSEGQLEEAWQLLQGESPSLTELAELVYGVWTPASAWSAFRLLNRTPWFRGTPQAIEVLPPAEVEEKLRILKEKQEAEDRWEDFLTRFKAGRADPETDEPFLRDLEMYALGRSKGSKILKVLGRTQTPENAHRLMLSFGVKKETWNPWPLRLNLPLDAPSHSLPPLPDDEREDLRAVEAFAVDDEGNQDPDDAIAWDGVWFWVHVADVAALISPGTETDIMARDRAASLYLPEQTVPMLPAEAVAKLGLGLKSTSPALSYAFRPGRDGTIEEFRIALTRIRVTRLSYAEADARMNEEPFLTMKRITNAFREFREGSGAVTINLPEVRIRVRDGEPEITSIPRLAVRDMVTEAMLMAGHYAAAWCLDRNLKVPYTTQAVSDNDEANIPAGLAGQFFLRRGMTRSRITLESEPHAGLGLKIYSRVTSPLRRYPDLVVSQQIRAVLTGGESRNLETLSSDLAICESRAGALVRAERQSNLFWKTIWLRHRPGWTGEAELVELRERKGLFIIPELALEVWVPFRSDFPLGGRGLLKLREVDLAEPSALLTLEEPIP